MFCDVLVDAGGNQLLHAEFNLALLWCDAEHLRFDHLAGAQHILRMIDALVGANLADVDEADNVVQALQATPRGTLRVSVSIGIPLLLGPVIAKLTSLYPEVKLNMTVSDRMVDMIEERVDLAISLFPMPESRLIVRRVGS